MKRREFLEGVGVTGAAVAATSLGVEGCATGSLANNAGARAGEGAYAQDMSAYLAQLDGILANIDRIEDAPEWNSGPFAASHMSDEQREAHGRLAKGIMRSLTIAGMYNDLDETDRMHPGMQSRLWASADEITRTFDQLDAVFTSMTAEQRGALRERLRSEPNLMNEVHATLDRKAAEFGLPAKRRRALRNLLGQAAFRLREQDPGLLFDQFSEQYARLKRQALAADQGAGIAQQQQQPGQTTTLEPVYVPPAPGTTPPSYYAVPAPPRRTPRSLISRNVGLVMLGIGAGLGLLSVPVIALAGSSAYGQVTAGALMLAAGISVVIGGLIALIVAAVQWGNGD